MGLLSGAGYRTPIVARMALGLVRFQSYEEQMEEIRQLESGELLKQLEADLRKLRGVRRSRRRRKSR